MVKTFVICVMAELSLRKLLFELFDELNDDDEDEDEDVVSWWTKLVELLDGDISIVTTCC